MIFAHTFTPYQLAKLNTAVSCLSFERARTEAVAIVLPFEDNQALTAHIPMPPSTLVAINSKTTIRSWSAVMNCTVDSRPGESWNFLLCQFSINEKWYRLAINMNEEGMIAALDDWAASKHIPVLFSDRSSVKTAKITLCQEALSAIRQLAEVDNIYRGRICKGADFADLLIKGQIPSQPALPTTLYLVTSPKTFGDAVSELCDSYGDGMDDDWDEVTSLNDLDTKNKTSEK